MNIQVPQSIFFENLENKYLVEYIELEDENIEKLKFQNEEIEEAQIYDLQFKGCIFANIILQGAKIEKTTFRDVIFENCDFSNTVFLNCTFIRCKFINSKMIGVNLSENRLDNVIFIDCNNNYMNLSLASIEKVLIKDSVARNNYFQETKLKNIYFENVDLSFSNFFKTSLKNIDLSSSKIEQIAINIEDIKGAIIDSIQVMDLMYLLGVKIK